MAKADEVKLVRLTSPTGVTVQVREEKAVLLSGYKPATAKTATKTTEK